MKQQQAATLFLCLVSLNLFSAQKTRSEIFMQDCQTYEIEPGWIIRDFLKMNSDEFDIAWQFLVNYFKNDSRFVEKKRRVLVLEQCKCYDAFLKNLYVTSEKKLMLKGSSEILSNASSIFQYWKMKKKIDYVHFYAFYFDRVATEFVEVVINAQKDANEYNFLKRKAHQLFYQLGVIFQHLKNSEYDDRYAQHLRRYQEIKELLCKEVCL